MEETEAPAVERAREGDGDAFRVLVERHSRNVFGLAFRMTGNEQDAEDVVQETFLRAYRQLHQYESRSSFGTWLHRIAANYSLDLIRGRRRHEELHVESANVPDNAPAADRVAYSAQVRDSIAAALDQLSAQERTAFVLRHFDGMGIEEIGGCLGTSANATKHSIFRAVQKVRRALEPLVSAAI